MPLLHPDQPFIAIDWGDDSFRAALIAPDGELLDEMAEPRGILSFKPGEFAPYLIANCARFVKAGGFFYLLAGTIGSKRGLAEVPHCPCPADVALMASKLTWVVKDRIAILPGVRSEHDDIMRGKEIQVLGAASVLGIEDALMVLPDKHSKWVSLDGGAITGFNTFMTGEFYTLLSQHSTLSAHLPETPANHGEHDGPLDIKAYLQGIEHATLSESLLNTAFSVRVKSQFNHLTPPQAASYLSGLVIGEELVSMQLEPGTELVVVGAQDVCERYRLALEHLGVHVRTLGSQAAWAGLYSIYRQLL